MDGRANRRVRRPRAGGGLSAPALSPSDLLGEKDGAKAICVAGRVLMATEGELQLADAFGVIGAEGAFAELAAGDLVTLRGRFVKGRLRGASVVARRPAPTPRGDGEFGRFVFGGVGAALLARSRMLAALRAYFAEQRFIEVETPLRVPAPGVDANVDALRAQGGWLVTSPELEMKRLVVAGVPRQFQLARVTRRDESGALHEPEFTLLEWYRAFASALDVQRDTEELLRRAADGVRGKLELVLPDGRVVSLRRGFERVSVSEAFRRYAGVSDVAELSERDEARYFELLVERVEPALSKLDRPVFLEQYPISQAALARPLSHAPRYAERFELYVGGVELCNGYGELTDPREQRLRFRKERARRKAEGRSAYPINQRFLRALEEGMPDTGGNALGVDRLLMLALGARTIQDVIAFPRELL
ncbi:MAG: EF-P lysine aminoacylase EpmA [Polyangiaceae bacterium]